MSDTREVLVQQITEAVYDALLEIGANPGRSNKLGMGAAIKNAVDRTLAASPVRDPYAEAAQDPAFRADSAALNPVPVRDPAPPDDILRDEIAKRVMGFCDNFADARKEATRIIALVRGVRDPAPPDWKDVGSDGEKPLWDALGVGFRAAMAAGQMLETMDDSAPSLAAYNAEIDKWNDARSTIVKLYRAVRGVRDPSPPEPSAEATKAAYLAMVGSNDPEKHPDDKAAWDRTVREMFAKMLRAAYAVDFGVRGAGVPDGDADLRAAPLVDLADEYIRGAHPDSTVAQRPAVLRDFVKWVLARGAGVVPEEP